MENGIFIALTEFLLQGEAAILPATVAGMIAVPMLLLIMPIRMAWVLFHHFKTTPGEIRRPVLYRTAFLLLGLSVFAVLEVAYFFSSARGGEVSGVMIPMFSVVPFAFYLGFEILYAMSSGKHRAG